jgi:hypothetical protein
LIGALLRFEKGKHILGRQNWALLEIECFT